MAKVKVICTKCKARFEFLIDNIENLEQEIQKKREELNHKC